MAQLYTADTVVYSLLGGFAVALTCSPGRRQQTPSWLFVIAVDITCMHGLG